MTHSGKLRTAPVLDVPSASTAVRDIETYINRLLPELPVVSDAPPASGAYFLARDSDGEWGLYELIGGTGVTITIDTNAKTAEITSP